MKYSEYSKLILPAPWSPSWRRVTIEITFSLPVPPWGSVSLDGELQDNIANATDALFKTYRHYLEEKSSGFTPEELVKRLSALCKENERDNGFFRSHKPLSVNGQTLWLGLSSSTEVKKSHAGQLCQLLKLPTDAVQWFADGEQVYPASKQA